MKNTHSIIRSAVAAVAVVVVAPAIAQGDRTVSDPLEVSKIVHAVPAFRGDLGSRLSAGGMSVESISVHNLTKEDISEDPLRFARGDIEYRVFTKGEPNADGCRILGSPTFIKRGSRYLPQDRTGVWLLTGKCALPD
jgi:hypothetical protein